MPKGERPFLQISQFKAQYFYEFFLTNIKRGGNILSDKT